MSGLARRDARVLVLSRTFSSSSTPSSFSSSSFSRWLMIMKKRLKVEWLNATRRILGEFSRVLTKLLIMMLSSFFLFIVLNVTQP